jgi:hypothetical protein
LQGYQRGIRDSGVLPTDDRASQRLLKLFLIIRSVRALRHELERRPDMLFAAIDALLDQSRGEH